MSPVARRAADFPFFDHPGPLAFAHRGGAAYTDNVGLENSVAAFGRAVDLGYRYLETDVHATRDGRVLVFHDATLDRVTDQVGEVQHLDYADIRRARIGSTEAIPLLADVLDAWPHSRFNLDVKAANAIGPLAEVVRRTNSWDRVCIASFSSARVHRVRRLLGPRVATALGPVGVATLRLLPLTRMRRLALTAPAPCAQVPVHAYGVEVVTPGFVRRAHTLGRHVHVWTVDDAAEMSRLLDLGVDGLMTDRIDTLRELLVDRGQWYDGR